MAKHYDLIVVGAGAGGLNAAYEARAFNKKVLLVEAFRPGGECTWTGCIPSKALIQLADAYHRAQQFDVPPVDGTKIMQRVREITALAHQAEAIEVLEHAGIEYLQGAARFINSQAIQIGQSRYTADHFLVATGSSAVVPPIPGLKDVDVLTNKNVFSINTLPNSLIVLGAGAIGVELSQAFVRLGVEVTLVEMADQILPREEPELVRILTDVLKREGVSVKTQTKAIEVSQYASRTHLRVESGNETRELSAERLLIALGRKPNLHESGFENAGIELSGAGVSVNEFMQTSIPHIYAAGDIVGPFQFSHMAGVQARTAVKHMFGNPNSGMTKEYAWCTFTHPELARTGLTVEEAQHQHGDDVIVWSAPVTAADRAVIDESEDGKIIVTSTQDGTILGASILGARACEMLGEIQTLKTANLPVSILSETLHPYPSYSEALGALAPISR